MKKRIKAGTHYGWNQGVDFYNKLWEGWKKLSGDNKLGVWEKIESKWFEYAEET